MNKDRPSETAWKVAMRRAAHQVLDHPAVYRDPLALRMVGMGDEPASSASGSWREQTPLERPLRAFLAARSRYAEDVLHTAVDRGVRQFVILGAGLDTFAYRNPYPETLLHVFEVDHPSTQEWKQIHLRETGIPVPGTLSYTAVDFETGTLEEGLFRTGFDGRTGTLFSWLGVTVYLSREAITDTLRFVASLPAGSGIVFDYMVPPSLLTATARRGFDLLAHRVASAGEPFRTFFDPPSLQESLRGMGFGGIEDLGPEELNERYFRKRADGLRVGSLAHVLYARV